MTTLDATTYSKYNSVQKLDALFVLNNYLKFLSWHNHDTIIDVGTGDGSVLVDVLLPKLPNYGKVVALDASNEMLKLAQNYYKNPKIEYFCMDIRARFIPRELQNVDHIFSFYCLHWVKEQRLAVNNIFHMLKPGGDILLTLVARHSGFVVFKKMAKIDKWARYMMDVDDMVSPYQFVPNPAKEMGEILKNVGFAECKCEVVERKFVHGSFLDFKNWVLIINPFVKRIPEKEIEDYKEDYLKEYLKLNTIKVEEGKVYDTYEMLIVIGIKPK